MTFNGALAGMQPWTSADLAALALVYAEGGIAAARTAFPSRSRWALFHAAARVGATRRPLWTRREDERLRTEWGTLSMRALSRLFGRPRDGVYMRAKTLGLEAGCPAGCEYLSHAAARCGYTTGQLRRILAWSGVRVRESYSRTHGPRRPFHIVDPLDVDDAVEAWHRTETLEAAARRVGCSAEKIKHALAVNGAVLARASRRPKGHYRVDSAAVDAAMGGVV